MLSEPVFLIPLLAWSGGLHIQPFFILIAVFQIMSIFAIQLGKYSPPEYQSGAVAAFILHGICHMELVPAIAMGIVFAYIFNAIFNLKISFNDKLISSLNNRYLCIGLSLIISVLLYWAMYIAVYVIGQYASNMHSSWDLMPLILALAILKTDSMKPRPMHLAVLAISLLTTLAALWFM